MQENSIDLTVKPERGKNPNSLKNLKPFKPGQSGNPKGVKPGTISITAAIKERMNKKFPERLATVTGNDGKKLKKAKKTYLQKVVETIFDNAIVSKDQRTLKDIWSYIDGQPKATIDIGADKESLEILTEYFKKVANIKEKNEPPR